MSDNAVNKIRRILKENNNNLTITEIVESSKLSRSAVRIGLAKLEGAEKIEFRSIGMAKIYFLKSKLQMGLNGYDRTDN